MSAKLTREETEQVCGGRPLWAGLIGLVWVVGVFYHFFTTLGFIDLFKQVMGLGTAG